LHPPRQPPFPAQDRALILRAFSADKIPMSGLLVVFLYLLAAAPAMGPATSREPPQRATERVHIGRPEEALPYFSQAIKLRLDNPDAWMGRGRALVTLGRYRDAIDDFDEAVRLEPATAEPLLERGYAFGQAGDFRSASEDLTRVLRIDPANVPALPLRGAAHAKLGLSAKATEDFTHALELTPNDAQLHLARATLYAANG